MLKLQIFSELFSCSLIMRAFLQHVSCFRSRRKGTNVTATVMDPFRRDT